MATINGGIGNDTLSGTNSHDLISGSGGNDSIYGHSGNDTIQGGTGDDQLFGGTSAGAPPPTVLSPNWVEVTSTGQAVTGTNGQSNFTATTTSTDSVSFVNWSSISNGFWIGNGSVPETHTHTMSTQVAGAQLRLSATHPDEPITFILDGVTVNLNDAIASGIVTFNNGGRGTYIIDAQGRFAGRTGLSPVASEWSDVATLTFNIPFTTLQLASADSVESSGSAYELFVDTNPPPSTSEDDVISGDAGNDSLYGGDGNDTLSGGVDNDWIDGGAGNDSLDGGTGNDQTFGGSGNDTITGGAGNDLVSGDAGNDRLTAGAGDTVNGGDGSDTIVIDITQLDALGGTASGITIDGGSGGTDFDVLDLRGLGAVRWTFVTAESGTVTYTNGTGQPVTITFSEIESLLTDNDGIVTGTEAGQFMGSGFTDADGDRIGDGADSIRGMGGNDNIAGGGGNDTISGGDGNDFLGAGVGDDVVAGDAGEDFLDGNLGNDSLDGGTGNDTLSGGQGADTLSAGVGNDEIWFGGADQAFGGADNDLFEHDISETSVNATLDGGSGTDTLDLGWETVDLTVILGSAAGTGTVNGLDGDAGTDITFGSIEHLRTGEGNDTVDGSAATTAMVIETGLGDDSLRSGSGSDTLDGGAGDDFLTGGAGDVLIGGAGDDTFGFDTLASGTLSVTVTGGEAGEDALGDALDLTGLTNATVTWDGGTRISESGTLTYLNTSGQLETVTFSEIERVVCFARGTLIRTARGAVAIQDLRLGDLVMTADRGPQPVRWLAGRSLPAEDLAAAPHLAPIRISRGALGPGLPVRDLIVSPQHRILIRSKVAERMFGSAEVLVAAKQLIEWPGIDVVPGCKGVEYWHVMCDHHEVIEAEGLATETLFTGPQALAALPRECLEELNRIFPGFHEHVPMIKLQPARPLPRGAACRKMIQRHLWNKKQLIQPVGSDHHSDAA